MTILWDSYRNALPSIASAVGRTPLVKLNRVSAGVKPALYLKIEWFGPSGSLKDRIYLWMFERAEARGDLKPGMRVLECSTGNAGIACAFVAAVKGYRCTIVMPEGMSEERKKIMRAYGADLVFTVGGESDVDLSLQRLAEIRRRDPAGYWVPGQFDNADNIEAHYRTTGPEIWEQTGGRITQLVVGVGTGGTISGVGRFLKEKNPKIKVWGIDTYGSVLKKYKDTGVLDKNEIYPYITEGIGEDFLPKNVDFSVIDHFEKVTDKDAAVMTRRIAREEGIFAGNSAGSAMAGLLQLKDNFRKDDVIVVIFHDHGSRYLGKMFNDDWMREKGFFEKSGMTARDLVASGVSGELLSIEGSQPVEAAVRLMGEHDFSQISIIHEGRLVGSLNETHLYTELVKNSGIKTEPVETIMQPAFPFVDVSTPVDLLSQMITPTMPAVLVRDFKTDKTFIITRSDIIRVLM
jgi:cystathionine beta-synthase